jgi:hypothetical protein
MIVVSRSYVDDDRQPCAALLRLTFAARSVTLLSRLWSLGRPYEASSGWIGASGARLTEGSLWS